MLIGIRFGWALGLVGGDPGLKILIVAIAIAGDSGFGVDDGLTPMPVGVDLGLMTVCFGGDLTRLGALDLLTIAGTILVGVGVGITGLSGWLIAGFEAISIGGVDFTGAISTGSTSVISIGSSPVLAGCHQ
ncbi:hypothetical protein [Chamaesiphon sp. OTE_75_metabat_556]|uniref:hypothetical protein n=1 Tax=Chamaesiphon sp. OTE_75_metabat_556 TaxID=2964692 RepID=UPI00286BF22F|nr:hypothetical protein [Chamaesiphon sp. OTE_75_metabat_556]